MAEVLAAVRIRPAIRTGGAPLSIKGQYGQFAYDYVIEENASQESLFSECILPQVNAFLQGVSSVVLVYGASQTGKTYTLEGGHPSTRNEGAIPRALHAICKNLVAVPKHRYKLYVTLCALSAGQEAHLVDLLAPGAPPVSLKDGSATGAMARLLHYQVESHEDIYEVLRQGRMTRASAFTAASGSPGGGSRPGRPVTNAAHIMLNIQLTGYAATGEQLATNLTFVELASPEAKDMMGYPTAADGALTRSLSLAYASLTAVCSAARAGNSTRGLESPPRGHSHVPWRDSPLTRWLKGCLSAAGGILVIATVAPGPEAAADTLATLSYVNRLRSGPKTDGLLVTATWDNGNGSAPAFTAAQQQQHHKLQQRGQQEQQEQERFGSPIQVRSSPTSISGSSTRPSSYKAPTQMAPSLDTRYTHATAAVEPGRRYGSPSRRGHGADGGLDTPTSATPVNSNRRGNEFSLQPPVQPLRTNDVLPTSNARGPSSTQQPPQPLSKLLASLQLGNDSSHAAQQGVRPASNNLGGSGSTGDAAEVLSRRYEGLKSDLEAERRETQRLRAELLRVEGASRSAAEASNAAKMQAAAEVGGLRDQVEALRKQLETSENAKQVLARRVQQLQEQQHSVLDLQAESSVLEAQVRALQDSLDATRHGQTAAASQLLEAKQAADALRQERDRLQRQNHELSDRLQAQVRNLSDETSKLRAQAFDAAQQVEAEQLGRRAAEAALAQLRVQIEGSRGAEGSALQQAAQLSAQIKELTAALEAVRMERNKLQDGKWRSDERAEQLALELDAAGTQQAKLEMEARAAATKADSDLRSAITAAEGLKAELSGARTQIDSLKLEVRAAQMAAEETARRESGLHTDVQELEALMRELDRDLEVQVSNVWRQLRSERADSLFGLPEGGAVAPARKWRPVLQALVGVIKRNNTDAEQKAQALDQARERIAALEAQVARTNELATSLAAHQQLKAAQLSELEESRRSIALLDQALEEANRECQRLHQQLEDLSGTHKAFTAEAAARESRLQAQAAEKEATLQAQLADREERLQSALSEQDRRLRTLSSEYDNRLQTQLAEWDMRLRNSEREASAKLAAAIQEREARIVETVSDGEARLAAAVAEGDERLAAAVSERDARLRQVTSEAEKQLTEAIGEREARMAVLAAERDALQRQASSLVALQAEDKQERDMLRMKSNSRDQLLHAVWSEVRATRHACLSGSLSPPRTPPYAGPASTHSSPAGAGLSLVAVDPEASLSMDWAEPHCQERLLKGLSTVRMQVSKLHTELTSLRSNAALSDDLSAQLGVTRAKLGEAQRNVDSLSSRVSGLDLELREVQDARSTLQQQLANSEASVAALQVALSDARQMVDSLQEELALLSKSRDTWKETATQQEAQLREVYGERESRAGELSRLRVEAQSATTEASGSAARVKLLESQLQDAQGQVETLSARLAATDKALQEANTRAASLNGQLVLADSEARLKNQELLARVQAAEDAEKLARSTAKEAVERLEARLREAGDQGGRLVADLDSLRAERNEAQHKADDLHRQLLEVRARLVDAEHTAKQLHKVVGERDTLQEQLNSLRNAHGQATEDVRSLRRQLDMAHEQAARLSDDKTRLAAQLEGQRLDAIMSGMAPRTSGRIGALARSGSMGAAGGQSGGSAGSAGDAQRAAPASFARAYTGLAYPNVAASYDAPSVGASPAPARGLGGGQYSGVGFSSPTPIYDGGLRLPATNGGAGSYGSGEAAQGVRVHVRTSPPQPSSIRPL